MSKLNLIAIVAIVAAFAMSAVLATEVFAQSNSTSSSSPAVAMQAATIHQASWRV